MNTQITCSNCKNTFYISNIITIGNPTFKSAECPICKKLVYISTSGNPKVSKLPMRKILPSSLLNSYNDAAMYPMFENCIYHITSENNIDLIKQNGLLPYSILKAKNVSVTTGGDINSLILDNTLGLDNYIHLSFTKWCPMFHKKKQLGEKLYLLKIDLDVINQPDVLFCDRIATAKDALFYETLDKETFDFEAVYGYLDWSSPAEQSRRNKAEKYEILVSSLIKPDMIINYELIR